MKDTARKSFKIVAKRLKAELDEDKSFYWFYISLHLEPLLGGPLSLADVELVEYHLLDGSFPDPDVRISARASGFEYRFWLYGFIRVSAEIVDRRGEVSLLPPTKLEWNVTKSELELNGRYELGWS